MEYTDSSAMGLGQAFTQFCRHDSPRVLLPLSAGAVIARIGLGGWKRRDLGIAAAILGAEPFTEWLIHVLILHFRPRTVGGRAIDPLVARKHRQHHQDPRDEDLIFVPMEVLKVALPAAVAGWAAGERDLRRALTGVATSYAMLTTYEWTHFLIHSSYRPRHRLYRRIWRAHRLHHFRNEHYWFGVTTNLGDRILRTFPDRERVPRSPTARTLGVPA
ncbi:MAG TPA: sterol desaturase family protein [Acidimicrobiales bacterium]|nr:sterol desaturase family protein [Acidimicrobiales bacterium]